jgi:predicted nucleic acid-binding protein
MRVVADSSVLIDILRGDASATRLVSDYVRAGDEVWGIVITRTEVLAGMRSAERRLTEQLLAQPLWLEVDAELADRAGELARTHRRSHPGIGLADYLIAAGVQRLGARLLTRNVKHFPMLPDLEPAY